MTRLALAAAALLLASCATPDPAPAGRQVVAGVLIDPDAAMRDICIRKVSGRSRMTPQWKSYCDAIGIRRA